MMKQIDVGQIEIGGKEEHQRTVEGKERMTGKINKLYDLF